LICHKVDLIYALNKTDKVIKSFLNEEMMHVHTIILQVYNVVVQPNNDSEGITINDMIFEIFTKVYRDSTYFFCDFLTALLITNDNQHNSSAGNTAVQAFLPRCMQCRRGIAMRILSVCPSHACIVTKTVERSVQIYIPYERTFILVF